MRSRRYGRDQGSHSGGRRRFGADRSVPRPPGCRGVERFRARHARLRGPDARTDPLERQLDSTGRRRRGAAGCTHPLRSRRRRRRAMAGHRRLARVLRHHKEDPHPPPRRRSGRLRDNARRTRRVRADHGAELRGAARPGEAGRRGAPPRSTNRGTCVPSELSRDHRDLALACRRRPAERHGAQRVEVSDALHERRIGVCFLSASLRMG